MAVLRVTTTALYRGESVVNRWYYLSSGSPAAVTRSFALFRAFGFYQPGGLDGGWIEAPVLRLVTAIQTDLVQYNNILVENLYDDADFYDNPYPPTATGRIDSSTTVDYGPAVALGYRTTRVTRAIRRGRKAFAGVTEQDFTGGGFLQAGAGPLVNQIAGAMAADLTYNDEGNTITFKPAILSFERYTTPAGNPAYRKYPTAAEQEDNAATGFLWENYPTLRTQRSRQYGRGV